MTEDLEKCQAAIRSVLQALASNPCSVMAHYDLGTLYLKAGDLDRALEQHRILMGMNRETAVKLMEQILRRSKPASQ